MKKLWLLCITMAAFNALADDADKRREVRRESAEILQKLYQQKPDVEDKIANAAGYATFSNVGVNILFVSAGGGKGMVHDNETGNDVFMNMGTVGVGLGLGVKDFRAVFVFHERDALTSFVEKGWDFSGQADAAAKSGKKGGEKNVAGSIVNGVSVYQMTESGLALQATLQGTKYWKSEDLN